MEIGTNTKTKDILQILFSLGLGIVVFYLVYRQLNLDEMKEIIKTTRWGFFVIPILLCLLSSWIRALRWNMLIEPVSHTPALKNTFCAVMFGYFINHLFPRAGEVARCGILKKYEDIPISELLGTVIAERSFDLLVTLLIVFLTVFLEFDVFKGFLDTIHIWDTLISIAYNPLLWIIVFACIFVILAFRNKIKQYAFYKKLHNIGVGIWNGLKSFTKTKNKPLFLLYSVGIFFVYYLMLYTSFWLFDFTADLSLNAGLVTYVFGSLGMVAPVQGGIGTYEFMTIQALSIYDISPTQAGTFAVLAHLVEIIVNCVVGFVCSLLLPLINKKEGAI